MIKLLISQKSGLLFMMRLGIVNFLLSVMLITASNASPANGQEILDRRVSLTVENKSIKEVLAEIEAKTNVKFTYSTKLVKVAQRVTINVAGEKISQVLNELFSAGIHYEVVKGQIVLTPTTNSTTSDYIDLSPSAFIVSGTISDETGLPLPGVSVIEKGTANGTTSDADGKYSINISSDNATLVFSFIGYTSQEIAVGSQSSINVKMVSDVKNLSEVVVVGYGTQEKKDVTGAIGSVRNSDFVNKPFTSPDQILAGRVSGVHVANRSGDPAAPIEVRIRGVGTAGNNQPLWVIDGVPVNVTSNVTVNTSSATESNPLAGLNPSDIESIDVLKDASATAIFGARASNGVIMVTTKRGKAGKTSLNYEGYVGLSSVPESKLFKVLNPQQYVALQSELGNNLTAFAAQPNVNWQNLVFKTGKVTNHNLSVSGGSENATFNISGGYLNQEGIELAQSFKRFSFKATSDFKVRNKVKFGESILVSATDRGVQSEDAVNAASNSAKNAPYFQPYTSTGAYNPANVSTGADNGKAVNFVWLLNKNAQETRIKNTKILGNVYGELELIKNLKYRANASIDLNVVNGTYYEAALDYSGGTTPQQSIYVQERPIESTRSLGNTLQYNNRFGDHSFNALVGYEQTDYALDKLRVQGTGLNNPAINLAGGAAIIAASKSADQWAIKGLLSRVNYSFKDKYLFTFNLRRDESSRFAQANRSGVFPSFSVGWRASEESFIKNIKAIENLKLRASWGRSGNQFTGTNFAYLSSLGSFIRYVVGTGNQNIVFAAAPEFLANNSLKWETTDQVDIGMDLSLFSGKVNATIDYFQKTTNDLLISVPIPLSTGYFGLSDVNAGQLRNTGVELAVGYQNKVGEVSYHIGGNITFVKNEFLKLARGVDYIQQDIKRISVGQSLGYFYGYKTNGIYQSDAEVPKGSGYSDAKAGDVKFADLNNDGILDDKDRTKIGKAIPGYFYGVNVGANYKNFDLSILFQGVGDFQIYNAARLSLEQLNNTNNQLTSVLNRWTPTNPSNSIPRAGSKYSNERVSDRWIENGDFVRVKNLQIGYTFKSPESKYFSSARVYVGVSNLFTLTKYRGYDPEVTRSTSFTNGENQFLNGIDNGGAPQPRLVQVGWTVTF